MRAGGGWGLQHSLLLPSILGPLVPLPLVPSLYPGVSWAEVAQSDKEPVPQCHGSPVCPRARCADRPGLWRSVMEKEAPPSPAVVSHDEVPAQWLGGSSSWRQREDPPGRWEAGDIGGTSRSSPLPAQATSPSTSHPAHFSAGGLCPQEDSHTLIYRRILVEDTGNQFVAENARSG